MDKKNNLLSNLKRQVIALKTQLQCLEKHKQSKIQKQSYQSRNNQSVSHSQRFNSISLDCSYLERGIKKFHDGGGKFKNFAQIIKQKSQPERIPSICIQRKAEYEKTKQNFSSDRKQKSKTRSRSPNPLTGEGYQDKKSGKKTTYELPKEKSTRLSSKKHFNFYY